MHPNRVVGPRPVPKYDGPDPLKPSVTVNGQTGPVPDLNWLQINAPHVNKIVLDNAPHGSGAEAVLIAEGKHPVLGAFTFRSGFRERNVARTWADSRLGHVQNRENRLRDGGY